MRVFFRKHRLLIISGLLGLSAAAITYAAIAPYVETVSVVVAARDVEQYTAIRASDVKVMDMPLQGLPEGRFSSASQVVGNYAATRLVQGQIVLPGHIARGVTEIGLSFDLAQGERCVFIAAGPDRAVGGLVKEGELVDIVFTPRSTSFATSAGLADPPALGDIRVLRVCHDPSSRIMTGLVVLATKDEAETIARNLESCAVSILLAPRGKSGNTGTGVRE